MEESEARRLAEEELKNSRERLEAAELLFRKNYQGKVLIENFINKFNYILDYLHSKWR